MELRVLGPVEVWAGSRRVEVGSPRQCAVLAALAVDAGRLVSVEVLLDRLWGEHPPERARRTLHTYIGRVRRVLDEIANDGCALAQVVHRPGGYLFDVDPNRVDLHRFRRLIALARDPACVEERRVEFLREAIELWRGEPLAGVPGDWAERTRRSWVQQRVEVMTAWAQAELRAGEATAVVGPLSDLADEHPLVEPLMVALMRALVATGRRAEALQGFATIRRRLADELGTDPGAELQAVHQAVLRGELVASADSRAPAATARAGLTFTLPADISTFSGRGKEINHITARVASAKRTGHVVTIDGMPGVGKTTLAVHLAHRLTAVFPDCQLFVDLHAHTAQRPQPADPTEVLASLLVADGVATQYLPDNVDDRAAMWRDRMARRRAILVLDNAASSTQVTPLLPGSTSCLVIVTSRRFLGDLTGATTVVPLDVPSPDQARQMFEVLAPQARADATAVAKLVDLCGQLPIAISLLARMYSRHPTWTIAELIDQTTSRLLTVTAENRTISVVFDLSYRNLAPIRQRVLCLLGLHPGPDFDPYATAALTELPLDQAVEHLNWLHGDRLITESAYHRFRMHDLIRDYARARAGTMPSHERDAALDRLLGYYAHTAHTADTRLALYLPAVQVNPWPRPMAVPDIPDELDAQAWFNAERANLLACIRHATVADKPAHAVRLTAAIANHLRASGPWAQAIELHTAAATLARELRDRLSHSNALTHLGIMRQLSGDYPAASSTLRQALRLYQDIGDKAGRARVLTELATVQRLGGEHRAATITLKQAREIYEDIGDRTGQTAVLNELGAVLYATDDYPAATTAFRQALKLCAGTQDRRGRATALRKLGAVQMMTGDYAAAITALQQALTLSHEINDRSSQANALGQLGVVLQLTGRHTAATSVLQQALDIFEKVGHELGRANALAYLGLGKRMSGDCRAAASTLRLALNLYQKIGHKLGQANALTQIGVVLHLTGDLGEAIVTLQQAHELHQSINNREGQTEALNHLGTVYLSDRHPQQARQQYQRALNLARAIHNPLEEARAMEGLGRCARTDGQPKQAVDNLKQALHIYQNIGAAEAEALAAELNLV